MRSGPTLPRMSGRRRILPALAAGTILLAAPTAGFAEAKSVIVPAATTSSFGLPGSNGYFVEFKAARDRGSTTVSVTAARQRGKVQLQSVEYSVHGRLGKGGAIEARLPGLGRVAVEFEQAKVERSRFAGSPSCSGRAPLVRRGVFHGTIAFQGEDGFTAVHRRSATGMVRETFPQTCREVEIEPSGSRGTPNNQSLFAGGPSGEGTISFSAAGPRPIPGPPPRTGLPTVQFDLSYATELRGMRISARAVAASGSDRFSVTAPAGAPTDATLEPPAPFEGNATFHLESPTAASWTGDLSANLPGIGPVALTGPGIAATLCEGTSCTETGMGQAGLEPATDGL